MKIYVTLSLIFIALTARPVPIRPGPDVESVVLFRAQSLHTQTSVEASELGRFLEHRGSAAIVVRYDPGAFRAKAVTVHLPKGELITFRGPCEVEEHPDVKIFSWIDGDKQMQIAQDRNKQPYGWIVDGRQKWVVYSGYGAIIIIEEQSP